MEEKDVQRLLDMLYGMIDEAKSVAFSSDKCIIKELYHVANTYTEDALRRTEEAIQAALTEVQESRARFRAASKEQMQAQRQQLNSSAAEKGGDSQQ